MLPLGLLVPKLMYHCWRQCDVWDWKLNLNFIGNDVSICRFRQSIVDSVLFNWYRTLADDPHGIDEQSLNFSRSVYGDDIYGGESTTILNLAGTSSSRFLFLFKHPYIHYRILEDKQTDSGTPSPSDIERKPKIVLSGSRDGNDEWDWESHAERGRGITVERKRKLRRK